METKQTTQQMLHERAALEAKEDALCPTIAEFLTLPPHKKSELVAVQEELKTVNKKIAARADQARYSPRIPGFIVVKSREDGGGELSCLETISEYLRSGTLEPSASVSLGGSAGALVPDADIRELTANYPGSDPFVEAGASVTPLQQIVPVRFPWLLAGTATTTYAEGSGPTSSQEASIVHTDATPAKNGLLEKYTEEVDFSLNVVGQFVTEGVRRMINSETASVTSALMTSLFAQGCAIGSDDGMYQSLVNLISAVDQVNASGRLVFMGSRAFRAGILGMLDLQNRPLFNFQENSLLGFDFILNDNVPYDTCLFGNFANGLKICRSQMLVQKIDQLYTESGLVGIRFIQYAAAGWFAQAASHDACSSQPIFCLTLGGS